MAVNKIELQDLRLNFRYEKLKKISRKEFSKIKEFIDLSKNGEGSSGKDITDKTERKYIDALIMTYNAVKKNLLQLTKEDLTKLKKDLKSGKINSKFKRPYTLATIRDMQMILIRFLEWAKPSKYSGFRKWFIVSVPKKDVEYLKEEEIEKLYKSCKNNAERYLIAVLFCGGFRASEFLNIRAEDITPPTQSFPYYKINIKIEYSKTKGRNIGMYWKYCTEAIRDYLNEIGELKPKEQVFKKNYDAIRLFITRLGKRVLKKRVYFHIFRKSSATYYAPKINRQQMCYRYGWNFSSDVVDIYINRELGEEVVKDSILNIDMNKVKQKNQELQTKIALAQEKNEKQIEIMKINHQKDLLKFNKKLNLVVQALTTLKDKNRTATINNVA